MNLTDWIDTIQSMGCGEILITSIDQEGTESGFDLELLDSIYNKITRPLIISGGCGDVKDIKHIKDNYMDTSVAIASILHYEKISISEIKNSII